MRRSYICVHVQLVWATWDRLPLIAPEEEPRLYGAIRAKCEELGCEVLAVGGTENHVHLLVRLSSSVSISQLAHDVKGSASHLMNRAIRPGGAFKWQGAYGAFAVEEKRLPIVVEYIRNQKEHHAAGTEKALLEKIFESDT